MKRWLAALLALMLLAMGTAVADEDGYLSDARTLAEKVGELARDEAYQDNMTGADFDCIEALKEADFSALKNAWRCDIPAESLMRMLTEAGGTLSEAGMERLMALLPSTILTMYNSRQGTESVAASSILTYACTYRMSEGFEPCLYVLELEGALVGVMFTATGEDTITATAMPIFPGEGQGAEQVIDDLSAEEFPLTFEKIA